MIQSESATLAFGQKPPTPEQLAEASGCDLLIYDRVGHGRSSELPLPRPDDYLVYEGQVMLPRLLEKMGIERALLVLVENRLYIAIATWSEPAPSDAPLARFFESFEVWAP